MRARAIVAVAFSVLAIVACQAGEDFDESGADLDNSSLVCTSKPVPRSYVFFDGSKLEDKRSDESFDANRARFKPFSVMADEYKRVIGVVPRSLAASAATFEDPPPRWHSEPAPSGVTLNAIYGIALEGCAASVAATPERATAPTDGTAASFCKDLMLKAWGQAPSNDELGACVNLATRKLAGEPDARKRWAHVCATILSSSQFLTY